MSEQAPERAPARAKGGNVFTHRIGPLPMWIWVALAGGVIVAWSFYKSKTSAASTSTASGVPASDVPQFVNQTYTTVSPPNVTVDNTPDTDESPPAIKGNTAPSGPAIPSNYHPPIHNPPAPRPGGKQPPIFNATYMVRKGDTLNSVAKRFGITRVELAHANGLGTGAGLRTGQRIKVPQPKGTGTPNKAA